MVEGSNKEDLNIKVVNVNGVFTPILTEHHIKENLEGKEIHLYLYTVDHEGVEELNGITPVLILDGKVLPTNMVYHLSIIDTLGVHDVFYGGTFPDSLKERYELNVIDNFIILQTIGTTNILMDVYTNNRIHKREHLRYKVEHNARVTFNHGRYTDNISVAKAITEKL